MGLFRRNAKDGAEDRTPDEATDAVDDLAVEPAPGDGATKRDGRGPWDSADQAGERPRVDLGALLVPGVEGMELRMEIDKATEVVSAVNVSLAGSSLQLQAYAAPRTEGIWDEIREEIAASVVQQGGSVDDLPGPFGRELLARMPVRTNEGRTGHRPVRFVGVDGPRWFVRGVITGRAAVEPEAASVLEDLLADVVVVRDADARAPRDLLPLQLPGRVIGGPQETVAEADELEFDPLTRGPEITETR
ncbi:DUF3710 domain-containing protein [Cellulomonas sp. HZM]|uniref:DUF3710 domain-containing protein n=1 Tax=Cellulomonas sp. HZM TaxID=1454010 RepID=UPI0004932F34|nr:DUF3710 domain-containing protein [Cellulomonas sp. HZM]